MELATDICVYYSAKDTLAEGSKCVIVEKGVGALDQDTFIKEKGVKFMKNITK